MSTHWSTLADTLADVEAVTLNDTRCDAHALVGTLAASLAEVEVETLGDTWSMRKHCSTLWLTR